MEPSAPMASGVAAPPLPPSPPTATRSVSLLAGPLTPDSPLPAELAPALASLLARPTDDPAPVWGATVVLGAMVLLVVVCAAAAVAPTVVPPRKASRPASTALLRASGARLSCSGPVSTPMFVLSRTRQTQTAVPPSRSALVD